MDGQHKHILLGSSDNAVVGQGIAHVHRRFLVGLQVALQVGAVLPL